MTVPTLDEMDDAVEGLLELFEEEDSESLADIIKASFGGDRSAAGRYAAEQRWKGHTKKQPVGSSRSALPENLAAQLSAIGDAMTQVREQGVQTTYYRKEDIGPNGIKELREEMYAISKMLDKVADKAANDFDAKRITQKGYDKVEEYFDRGMEAVRLGLLAVDAMQKEGDPRFPEILHVSRDSNGKLVGLAQSSTQQEEGSFKLYSTEEQVNGRAMYVEFLVSFQTVPNMGRALFGEVLKAQEGMNVRMMYLETTEKSQDYWERIGWKRIKWTGEMHSSLQNYHTLEVPLDDMASVLP